jgi:K+-transporting ATPase ATPase A chain
MPRHPFENPTAWSNYLNIFAMLSISSALVYTFGQMVGNRRQGWALISAMAVLFIAGVAVTYWVEAQGNTILTAIGVDPALGNMEGKEVRFGQAMTALYAAVTTGLSNGGVNGMHGSFTGLGGLVPMFLIQLGEVLPGGVGSGLYGMLVFAILSVFVAGLMVGRTPEFLGKKIEGREMSLRCSPCSSCRWSSSASHQSRPCCPLLWRALAQRARTACRKSSMPIPRLPATTARPSAGSQAIRPGTTPRLASRCCLAASPMSCRSWRLPDRSPPKVKSPASAGTFPTDGPLFVGLLIGIILILGGLQFLPALVLGPIVEHFAMLAGQTF